jgi:hypothetical protein
MFPDDEGLEPSGVQVAESPDATFTGVPHFAQNALSGGRAIKHDGQSLTGDSLPERQLRGDKLLSRLYNEAL